MKFDITNIIIQHTTKSGYNYQIKGIVNGVRVMAFTNDSEAYDWLNDDIMPELHEQAVRHCETKLMEAYLDGGY